MMTLSDAVAMFLRHREIKNLQPATMRLYRRRLQFWLAWREERHYEPLLAVVTADELRTYLHYLMYDHVPHERNPRRPASKGRMAVNSVQSDWRILRALWMFLKDDDLLSEHQEKVFTRNRVPCPRESEPELRPVCPPDVFDQLLRACASDEPEEEWRNKAIFLMLHDTGARIGEIVGPWGLRDRDIFLAKSWGNVRGKGGKRRWIYWSEETGYALTQYMQHRRGKWGGELPLFRGMSSRNNGDAFTTDALRSLIRRIAKRAGISLIAKAPLHSMRHAFAHDGLDEGIDEFHLQQLLGHQSPTTTARYTRENPSKLRRVYDRFYRRRRRPLT
ncbi:MAG: site-specific integrase [Candidatus Viridilinea halotolerans]|uniref:Site-specific integrase n=1 Tax=Candidatus Viridilinea halotolerans TaxID=2491704 RepID=A0A426U6F0_9CHLR|nr:MAG: site-specific integrase [Candidatus Viridilinea halotolerans]